MKATLLLLSWIYLLFCNTSQAVVKELMEQKLEAKGVVKNGSTAYYDAENATWKFSVNLRVPQELNDKKIKIRVELTEEGENQENRVFNCKLQSGEPFNSSTRFKMFTMSFEKFDEVNTVITFDHVYSGNYTLVIIRCKNLLGPSCVSGQKDKATYNNLPVVTNLNKVDVNCMNITIRAVEGEGGIDVHFSVNYSTNQPLLEFKKFEVVMSQGFKILESETTNGSNVILSSTNLLKVNRCSHRKKSNTTLCSNYYTFEVKIRPYDTRCNYPLQVYLTSKLPCIRHITAELKISSKGIRNGDRNIYVSSPLNYIWIPLLIVTLSTCVAMFHYLRRIRGENQQQNFTMAPTFSDVQQTYLDSRKILLVYDMTDEVIKAKASIFRNQLITHGILTVYDSCDPQQEEIINTMGPVHWFNAHLNKSDVSVVIIQSSGFTRCFEELMRVDRVNDVASEQDNDLLLFVLHQLLFITSVSSQSKYDRIFVTTCSEFECTAHNYLTPYRCYILPEHFDLLISEIHGNPQLRRQDNTETC